MHASDQLQLKILPAFPHKRQNSSCSAAFTDLELSFIADRPVANKRLHKMKYSEIPASQLKFYTRDWKTPGTPIATVVFIHGFAEHCDRYDHVFKQIAQAGVRASEVSPVE